MNDFHGWDLIFDIGNYWLRYLHGDMLEIGMGASTDLFIELSTRYQRKSFHCDVVDHGIQLHPLGTFYCMSSNDLFATVSLPKMAITFIDGWHSYDQVKNDFFNALAITEGNGLIFMHDTLPPNDDYLGLGRCGDAYKVRQEIARDKSFDTFTFPFIGCPPGCGVTMVRKVPHDARYYQI